MLTCLPLQSKLSCDGLIILLKPLSLSKQLSLALRLPTTTL
jgi:hypothetical protein